LHDGAVEKAFVREYESGKVENYVFSSIPSRHRSSNAPFQDRGEWNVLATFLVYIVSVLLLFSPYDFNMVHSHGVAQDDPFPIALDDDENPLSYYGVSDGTEILMNEVDAKSQYPSNKTLKVVSITTTRI